jgi:hypothetical protein
MVVGLGGIRWARLERVGRTQWRKGGGVCCGVGWGAGREWAELEVG